MQLVYNNAEMIFARRGKISIPTQYICLNMPNTTPCLCTYFTSKGSQTATISTPQSQRCAVGVLCDFADNNKNKQINFRQEAFNLVLRVI